MVLRARFRKKTWLYFEFMICDKYRGKNTGPQCVNMHPSFCYPTESSTNVKHFLEYNRRVMKSKTTNKASHCFHVISLSLIPFLIWNKVKTNSTWQNIFSKFLYVKNKYQCEGPSEFNYTAILQYIHKQDCGNLKLQLQRWCLLWMASHWRYLVLHLGSWCPLVLAFNKKIEVRVKDLINYKLELNYPYCTTHVTAVTR
jgi:hypothetical protein